MVYVQRPRTFPPMLSDHFSFVEMTRSQTAARKGIDNTPDRVQLFNLQMMCIHLGDVIRRWFGSPVIVSSGFRCKKLNRKIGGSRTSQHKKGEAMDFNVVGWSPFNVFEAIINSGMDFDQIICEFDSWIHISWRGHHHRRQCLIASKGWLGRTKYTTYTPKVKAYADLRTV